MARQTTQPPLSTISRFEPVEASTWLGCPTAAPGTALRYGVHEEPRVTNYFAGSKNGKGEEEGIVVSISLSKNVMKNSPNPSASRAHPTWRRL